MRFAPRIIRSNSSSGSVTLVPLSETVILWGMIVSAGGGIELINFTNTAGTTLFSIRLGTGTSFREFSMEVPFLIDDGLVATNITTNTDIIIFVSNVGA